MKTISVIITVFNTEMWVRECIESIIQQKEIDFEIIIIDDGSTDNSLNICKEYEQLYDYITIIHTSNRGVSAARNLGISLSSGQYIHFIDSDDFLPDENLYKTIFKNLNNREVDLIVGRTAFFNHNRSCGLGENTKFNIEGILNIPIYDTLANRNVWSIQSSACNKIINREYILKNNLTFNEKILHEDDLWLGNCFSLNPVTYFYDDILYAVRRRDNSIMRTSNSKTIEKKAKSKLFISYELASMICNIQIDKNVQKQICANYISYFIDGIKFYYQINNKKEFLADVKKYKKVLNFARYTDSKNLKILWILSKILSTKMLIKIILKRYNVKIEGDKKCNSL